MQKANTSNGFSSFVVLLMLALKYICGERSTHQYAKDTYEDWGGDVIKRQREMFWLCSKEKSPYQHL